MADEIDELVRQLHETKSETDEEVKDKPKSDITEENMNQYILDKVGHLISSGCCTIDALKENILTGMDAREIEAFAELYKAVTGAVDVINKLNLQNKKHESAKELKQITQQHQIENPTQNNTNVLIATREEIMQKFIQGVEEEKSNTKSPPIDADFEEADE